MKKYIIFLLLALCGSKVNAQRMIYKQKSLEVNKGLTAANLISKNFYVNLTLNSFARHGNYWIWGIEYQKRTTEYKGWDIPMENYLGEMGYSIKLLSDARKCITLNAGLTVVGGYEIINNGDSILMDGAKLLAKDHFIYGAGGRFSLETYLSDRITFLVQGKAKAIWGTDLRQFRPSAGIGLRFNF